MELLFWAAALLVAYAYAGYPALIAVLGRLHPAREPARGEGTPAASVVLVARNEESRLEEKLRNLVALDYPREKLDILVVSDGSTDATETIAASFTDSGVRLLPLPGPRGK